MYSFPASRDAYARVYLKNHPCRDPSLPGPGAYDLKPFTSSNSKQYSMRPKTLGYSNCIQIIVDSSFKNSPGPGTYSVNSLINKDGKQILSINENSKASNFNPPSSDRFKNFCKLVIEIIVNSKRDVPGPGQYELVSGTTSDGKQFYANYRSSGSRTFGNESRSFPKFKQSVICKR